MTEAFKRVIRFLFDEVGVNRITATHDPRNPHSGDVMRKCGLRYEGTSRQAGRNMQGICDVSRYAILKEDYLDFDSAV
jgi:ribosomal-protein-alanine N-acetyltransferase